MTQLKALYRVTEEVRICRIYSDGWDSNIAAWEEEVREAFDEFCEFVGDDPKACEIVGEAKWVWMKFTKSRRAQISLEEFPGASQVTMIRVHRKRGKRERST